MVMTHDDLLKRQIKLEALLELMPDAVCLIEDTGQLLSYKVGADPIQTQLQIGQNITEATPASIGQILFEAMQKAIETNEMQVNKYISHNQNREYVREARVVRNGEHDFLCLVRDLTEHTKIEQSLVESERRFRTLTENASDLVLVLDDTGIYRYASPSHEKLLGYKPEDLLGTSIFNLFTPEDLPIALKSFAESISTNIMVRRKCRLLHRNGTLRTIEYVGRSCFDDPVIQGFVINAHDVTDRTEMEMRLRYQVWHDTLTGLPNRTALLDALEKAISVQLAKKKADRKEVALLAMNIDRFKDINDTFGHYHGDVLLQHLAKRLRGVVKNDGLVASLGGDEFALLLQNSSSEQVEQVIAAIDMILEEPFVIEDFPLQLQFSIGISLFPTHGFDALTLLRHADVAMYAAKREHLGYLLYDSAHDTYNPRRLAMIGALRKAITNNELKLFYQPKVDISTHKLHSVEALVRWQHPEFGFVPPDQFIPLAEQTGLITQLTNWVLKTAASQCREWLNGGMELSIAVNLSMWDLRGSSLVSTIKELLEQYELPPYLLRVELTESAVMTDVERTLETLNQLSKLGIEISVDDFGTGYSSLTYLKRMPISELKIDRSFVMHMTDINTDATIVQSTVEMAHGLGLKVVAEGVEDEKTWSLLSKFHCDIAQGYYMSRPINSQDLLQWMRTTKHMCVEKQ